jgi:hypothetical protein
MFEISNGSLRLNVLDPVADAELAGMRYCRGGYVWSVSEVTGAVRTSGPRWSQQPPPAYHGQGLPEVYCCRSKPDKEHLTIDDTGHGLIIGVGTVALSGPPDKPDLELLAPVRWHIERDERSVTMSCSDGWGPWAYALRRSVSLDDRTVLVGNEITNTGSFSLPVHWYAHPFFPPAADGAASIAIDGLTASDNDRAFPHHEDGLALSDQQDWDDIGDFAWLAGVEGNPLAARIRSAAGPVVMHCGRAIDRAALWANQHACSIEPFITSELQAFASRSWTMSYRFDAAD